MKIGSRRKVAAVIALLFIGQGLLHTTSIYPFWKKNYSTERTGLADLAPDQLIATFAGFGEMIAGLLWVQADSFFEQGNYDAILPIIRLVTQLDPHQIDVYATGMWHIGYNFTDEENRGDRRYIPSALALGREGTRNNPHTSELFFETGWLWYHRIMDDFHHAVYYWEQAAERDDMITARRNLLANAYMRNGQIDEALQLYYKLLGEAQERMDTEEEAFANRQNRDTIENNLDNHLIRMSRRGWFAMQNGTFDQNRERYDVYPPFNVGFSARVTVPEPKVLQVEGTYGVRPVGSRIRFILRDKHYSGARPGGLIWDQESEVLLDPPKDLTYLQDDLFVRNQRFNRRIDMSRDPTMYPFIEEEYLIEFFYSPRVAPPHIQDKFSWNGEGMTDTNFMNSEIRPGHHVLYTTLSLTRDQILRRGEWAMGRQVPVVQTFNYKAPRMDQIQGDIIVVPGLRAE